jgi:hypothetical protein
LVSKTLIIFPKRKRKKRDGKEWWIVTPIKKQTHTQKKETILRHRLLGNGREKPDPGSISLAGIVQRTAVHIFVPSVVVCTFLMIPQLFRSTKNRSKGLEWFQKNANSANRLLLISSLIFKFKYLRDAEKFIYFFVCLSISLSTRFFFLFYTNMCVCINIIQRAKVTPKRAQYSRLAFSLSGVASGRIPSVDSKKISEFSFSAETAHIIRASSQPAHPANYRNCFHFFIYLLCCTQLGALVCAVKTSFLARLVICWALRVCSLRALSASSHFFWVAEIRLARVWRVPRLTSPSSAGQ